MPCDKRHTERAPWARVTAVPDLQSTPTSLTCHSTAGNLTRAAACPAGPPTSSKVCLPSHLGAAKCMWSNGITLHCWQRHRGGFLLWGQKVESKTGGEPGWREADKGAWRAPLQLSGAPQALASASAPDAGSGPLAQAVTCSRAGVWRRAQHNGQLARRRGHGNNVCSRLQVSNQSREPKMLPSTLCMEPTHGEEWGQSVVGVAVRLHGAAHGAHPPLPAGCSSHLLGSAGLDLLGASLHLLGASLGLLGAGLQQGREAPTRVRHSMPAKQWHRQRQTAPFPTFLGWAPLVLLPPKKGVSLRPGAVS